MKKQNVNNRLAFNKANVTELNDNQMYDVDGGSTPACFVASVALSYAITKDLFAD